MSAMAAMSAMASGNSGRYDVRLVKVGLVEIQSRMNHLFANPDFAWRLGIAVTRRLPEMEFQSFGWTRNVMPGVVSHDVPLQSRWRPERKVRWARQSDWRTGHRHSILRNGDTGNIGRRDAGRSKF